MSQNVARAAVSDDRSMGPWLLHPALRFGDVVHDVADLVLVGLVSSDWQVLEDRTGRGIWLEGSRRERLGEEELAQALAEFRYKRRLIAAAELEAWLQERSLRLEEVRAVLSRRWLCARFVNDRSDSPWPVPADARIRARALAYQTRIGDSGLRLSTGEAQRVSIARAVYGRPSVLLMDEPTSALDAEAERAVKEGVDRLLQGRTAFIVAHRLSTVRDADLICVLDSGRLIEQGTHDELVRGDGLYAYLYAQQLAA